MANLQKLRRKGERIVLSSLRSEREGEIDAMRVLCIDAVHRYTTFGMASENISARILISVAVNIPIIFYFGENLARRMRITKTR